MKMENEDAKTLSYEIDSSIGDCQNVFIIIINN